jgi:hypothetical protein
VPDDLKVMAVISARLTQIINVAFLIYIIMHEGKFPGDFKLCSGRMDQL